NLVLLGNSIDMFDFSNVPAVLNASSGKIDLISLASAGEVSITDTGYDLSTIDQLGDISMDYGAVISTQGDPGGTIYIRAGNFVMENSYLDSSTVGIKDHSGIGIDIQVSNEFLVHTGIGTSNIGDKPVLFRQAALSNTNDQLVGGSAISSSTANDGQAGNIIIEAGLLDIDGVGVGYSSSAGNSGIVSRVFGTGNSGDINIKADTISLNESSMIATQAFSESSGNSGDIRIDVKDIRLNGVNGSSIISTSTQGSGNAGNLFIFSDHLLARGGVGTTQISSSADGGQKSFSHSGNVNISASKIELYDGAEIGADLFSGAGQGGDVIIKADTIDISGRDKDGYSAGVYSTVSGNETSGQGGNVFIQSQELYMDNYALVGVFNRPGSMGNSGSIDIKTDNLALTNGSIISGSAFGSGRGGDINIYANSIYLSGPSPYTEFTDDFFGEFTGIFTVAALEGGDAGNININAGSIDILDGAQINSQTGGRGQGGNININADRIFVSGYDPLSDSISRISASTEVYQDYARASGGDGGSLTITANTIELQDQGLITTRSTTTGDGGSLTISTGSLSLSSGAAISADSTNTGNAGTININASEIVSLSDSEITSRAEQSTAGSVSVHANQIEMYRASILASSAGNEAAGNINLAAFDSFVMEQSRITSEAQSANGGNIDILVNNTMRVTDSFITASVQGGNGNGGNIFIEPGFMIVDNSQITADAHGGDGGKVTIIAKSFIASANSNISASSELGISGNVTIDAPNRDLSAELAILPDSIIDVASLFRNDCAAVGSKYSSFIIKDSEQVSVSLLSPSFYVADSDSQETISDSYMADNSLLRTALNTDKSGGCGQSSVVF
ncbi:MAG: hypothetical protein OEZ33_02780, partial [Gammaproteobacteria bacterium]|nr:hypothetical protein [Gammaproteobacteria bacterium]